MLRTREAEHDQDREGRDRVIQKAAARLEEVQKVRRAVQALLLSLELGWGWAGVLRGFYCVRKLAVNCDHTHVAGAGTGASLNDAHQGS